jgi:hypothetical protein
MDNEVIAWYSQGALTRERLQSAINEAMTAFVADDEDLSQLGLSRAQLGTTRFVVTEEGGFIAEAILLGIAIGAGGNIASDVAKALWKKLLERIKDEEGEDAVGPEKQPGRKDDRE